MGMGFDSVSNMKMMAHVPNTLCMWRLIGLTCMLGMDDLGENPVQEYNMACKLPQYWNWVQCQWHTCIATEAIAISHNHILVELHTPYNQLGQ
jgi:hypothetical protein